MELRQLQTFRTVAETLSFTRAAEQLNYAQSSVTAQIQGLEEELGVPLFERLGKRTTLTAAGERLVAYAEKIVRLAEEARATVPGMDEPAGAIVVGAVESLCTYRLPPVLQQFLKRYPRAGVTLRPGSCADLRHWLQEGTVDLGFLMDRPGTASSLVMRELVREPIVVVAHPNHPLAARQEVHPADLDGADYLATEGGCVYRNAFTAILTRAGVSLGVTMEFNSVEAIKQCVMAGMGFTVLPATSVAAELAQGRLVALPWAGPWFDMVTEVAWHKDKWLSPTVKAFLDVTGAVLTPSAAVPGTD